MSRSAGLLRPPRGADVRGMTAAVLDRGHPAASWRATLRGPVPATLLLLLAVTVLATGVLPVVRTGAVLAGLVAAALAVGTDWLTRSSISTARAVVVPLAGTASVALLHAGTQSSAVLLLALAPASALAGTAQ